MNIKSAMMLRVLINRFNPKAGNALLKFLPAEEMQSVTNQNIQSTDILPILEQPQKVIKRLHYSWLSPLLNHYSHDIKSIMVACLSSNQEQTHNTPSSPISPVVRSFMLNHLYQQLKVENLLPIEYLLETELTPLLDWTKKQLVMLIDFLGIHDLASEVRYIVNKTHLNNLYSCLSAPQLHYLKVCLNQKQSLVAPKLGIDHSVKDCEKLKLLLHQRGLVRLSQGLAGQLPDFMWYLAHTLDVGRGKVLLNSHKENPIPNITPILKSQVISLMNFLKKSKLL